MKKTDFVPQNKIGIGTFERVGRMAESSGTAGLAWKRQIVSSEILRIQ